jgi:glycerol kinase
LSEGYILTIDQGTTNARAGLFQVGKDFLLAVGEVAHKEIRQFYPQPGWVEQDPMEIWQTQLEMCRQVIQKSGIRADELMAIGLTNQRETTVLWDRLTGIPLHNAIVWQDRRTKDFCQNLVTEGLEDLIRTKTGLLIDPYFSATKIKWLLDHVSRAHELARTGRLAFGTIDSWLIWNLTGGATHITDVSNASRTQLLNIHTGNWDPDLLEIFGIPESILPAVVENTGGLAVTMEGILPSSIAVTGMAGDQQAALFGQVCFRDGMVKNTYGTGCFMMMNIGATPVLSSHRLLTTVGWMIGGQIRYALEGSIFSAGAVIQWLRDGLGIIGSNAEIESLAGKVPGSEGVYLIPAFTGLGAPHWVPDARASICGITRGTNASHIARAALESIAYQSHDVLKCMEADTGFVVPELRVDGGGISNNLLMQIQSDVLDIPVLCPAVSETTSFGVAALAGMGAGIWTNLDEIQHLWREFKRYSPEIDPNLRSQNLNGWNRQVNMIADGART